MDNILFILVFFGIVLLMVSNSSANSQLIKNLNSNQPNNKKHKKRPFPQSFVIAIGLLAQFFKNRVSSN